MHALTPYRRLSTRVLLRGAIRALDAGSVRRGLVVLFAALLGAVPLAVQAAVTSESYALTAKDQALLDDVQQCAVRYFVEHSNPLSGLTQDRAPTSGARSFAPASIAATGFALSAWCIGDERGWLPRGEAARRIRTTLQFAADHVAGQHGWFYHFVDWRTGQRDDDCEVSTIDTALFLQGAIFAREYLNDPAIDQLVDRIYRKIDWRWALNGRLTLSMGWTPEAGFIRYRWDSYCELMGMYLLGLGAPAHPLTAPSWDAWQRGPRASYAGHSFIQCSPLFTHQYSHAWFDFRGVRDEYADYWQNSVDATLAQRDWSAAQKKRFAHWSQDMWGLTASDGPHGYMAWGTPEPGVAKDESDGTLVPCAPGGSLPFAPRECLTALENMRAFGMPGLWGRYGFADAFNPETGWVSTDVIGIDLGITLVMAENLRSGLVWREFMQAPEVRRGMQVAGFVSERSTPATRVPTSTLVSAPAKPAAAPAASSVASNSTSSAAKGVMATAEKAASKIGDVGREIARAVAHTAVGGKY